MINFILAALVVGSGIILGAILAVIGKEELELGAKYFLLAKNIIYSVIILAVSFYYFKTNFVVSTLILILLSVILIKKFQPILIYVSFAIIYILSSINSSLFILISSLIFFAGFPIGSIAVSDLKKNRLFNRRILVPYLVFISVILVGYISEILL